MTQFNFFNWTLRKKNDVFLCRLINKIKLTLIYEYGSDLRSYEHYLTSSEIRPQKKIRARTGFEPMTFAIPVQRSTNWANMPTGSWSLC